MPEAVAKAVWFSCLLQETIFPLLEGSPSKDLLTRSGITGVLRLLYFGSLLSFAK